MLERSKNGSEFCDTYFSLFRCCRLADIIGNIECIIIAGIEKPVDGFKSDMVGIDKVRTFPLLLCRCSIGFLPRRNRLGSDNCMFAIRFIPYRMNFNAFIQRFFHRAKLRLSFHAKTIADAERIAA